MKSKRNKQHSLALNAILNTTKTVLGMLLSIFTFPYVSRVLNVDSLGAYNYSYSLVSYGLLIAGLGVASYSIREGSQYRDDKAKMEQFVSEVFSINMISTIVSYIYLFVCAFLIPSFGQYRVMILILSIEIFCTTIGVTWIGNIYEDFLYITIRTIGFQIIYLLLVFLCVRNQDDIYKYIIITTVTTSGSNILNYFYLRNKYVKFHFTFHCNWKRHIKPILIIFSYKIAISIYVNSDKTILGILTDDYSVGLYSAAVKIYSIIKEILVAMVTVLIPRFAIMLNNNTRKETDVFFSGIFNTFTLLLLPATIGLFLMSPEIIYTIAGESYYAAGQSLRILSIAILFSMYANIYTTCILVPGKQEGKVFWATVISAVVNVVLNFILIPYWGINAAALTTVIAEIIVFSLAVFWAKEMISLVDVKMNIISILIACIIIGIVCTFCKLFINNIYLRVSCAIVGSAFGYFTVLLMLKNAIVVNVTNKFLVRIRRR